MSAMISYSSPAVAPALFSEKHSSLPASVSVSASSSPSISPSANRPPSTITLPIPNTNNNLTTTTKYATQNEELLRRLLVFYRVYDRAGQPFPSDTLTDPAGPLQQMLNIINGTSVVSLRIVDWFATNYAKEYDTIIQYVKENGEETRLKVHDNYKLMLKAYSKRRFDPFCRWERVHVPYVNGSFIETTIGQLNFFKWAIENQIVRYIEEHYAHIEKDMNSRNSTAKRKQANAEKSMSVATAAATAAANASSGGTASSSGFGGKTRKRREELSVSAAKKRITRENVEVIIQFN
jgi:hypothetical protein